MHFWKALLDTQAQNGCLLTSGGRLCIEGDDSENAAGMSWNPLGMCLFESNANVMRNKSRQMGVRVFLTKIHMQPFSPWMGGGFSLNLGQTFCFHILWSFPAC